MLANSVVHIVNIYIMSMRLNNNNLLFMGVFTFGWLIGRYSRPSIMSQDSIGGRIHNYLIRNMDGICSVMITGSAIGISIFTFPSLLIGGFALPIMLINRYSN